MTIGEKIRHLRKSQHLGLRELSRLSHVSPSQISRLEHGDYIPRFITVDRLAHGLHMTERYLYSYLGIVQGEHESNFNKISLRNQDLPTNMIIPEGYVKIPIVGSIPCGNPNTAVRETSDYKLVPPDDDYAGMIYLRADGNSMSPVIKNGELVKIHLQTTIESGQIAAVSIDHSDATLKKVVKDDNDNVMALIPINSLFSTLYPKDFDSCKIIGHAVSVENSLP